MEPQKIVKSYEVNPRPVSYPSSRPEGEAGTHKGMAYDKIAVFGPWTRQMMTALRRMYCEADAIGDKWLQKKVERAYNYLYTRAQKKVRNEL